ncbi:hypothetical protein ACRU5Z_14760, partial [Vibrio cholerae]
QFFIHYFLITNNRGKKPSSPSKHQSQTRENPPATAEGPPFHSQDMSRSIQKTAHITRKAVG